MDAETIVSRASTRLKEAVENLDHDLKSLRTGRANAAMLDGVMVEAYGASMPLNQVANVLVVDAQLIQLTPFDPSNLASISEAIRNNASLGLNPSDDGRVIRLPIPPLTEERRRELAKQINVHVEECQVRMRAVRHEAIDAVDSLKKDKSIGEDEAKRHHKRIEELVSAEQKTIEDMAKTKEKEILSI